LKEEDSYLKTRKPSAVVDLRRISAEKTSDEGIDSTASIGTVKTKLKRIESIMHSVWKANRKSTSTKKIRFSDEVEECC